MIEIRIGAPDDADAMAAAHTEGWRVGYRGVMPDDYLDDPEFASNRLKGWRERNWHAVDDTRLFAAVIDGVVVGFGLCGPERAQPECSQLDSEQSLQPSARRGEVYAFYLHPDAWGSGAATPLMHACTEHLRSLGFNDAVLWVLRDNPRARRFYEKLGWHSTGEESQFDGPVTIGRKLASAVTESQYGTRLVAGG